MQEPMPNLPPVDPARAAEPIAAATFTPDLLASLLAVGEEGREQIGREGGGGDRLGRASGIDGRKVRHRLLHPTVTLSPVRRRAAHGWVGSRGFSRPPVWARYHPCMYADAL